MRLEIKRKIKLQIIKIKKLNETKAQSVQLFDKKFHILF